MCVLGTAEKTINRDPFAAIERTSREMLGDTIALVDPVDSRCDRISLTTIRGTWTTFGLQHGSETFTLSSDSLVDKVRNIVGLICPSQMSAGAQR